MRSKSYKNLLQQYIVYESMPAGWKEIQGAQTAPNCYKWIFNGCSLFTDDYRQALLKVS